MNLQIHESTISFAFYHVTGISDISLEPTPVIWYNLHNQNTPKGAIHETHLHRKRF